MHDPSGPPAAARRPDRLGVVRRALRLLDARWINTRPAQAEFDRHRRVYPRWRIFHLCFAMVFCFLASFPVTAVEIALVSLVVMAALRTPWTYRMMPAILLQPIMLLALAWGAWQMITLAWSPSPALGLEFAGSLRWALLVLAIWPSIEFRPWLIGAWALGFVVGHATQLVHALTLAGLIEATTWGQMPNRISGWWGPVVGATALCGALGLHLGAAVLGTGRWRLVAIIAATITLIGVLATGTRGAWLAAGATIAIAGALMLARFARAGHRRPPLRALGIAAGALVLAGAGAWALAGEQIAARTRAAHSEIAAALRQHDYDTDTGARILMWRQAWRAWSSRPLSGVGIGGYQRWARADAERLNPTPPTDRIHAHAHGMIPHVAAETGLIGLALFASIIAAGFRGACRGPEPVRTGYERAPALALAGLLLAATFESIPVVTRSSVHLWVLLTLCPVWRPPPTAIRGTSSSAAAL